VAPVLVCPECSTKHPLGDVAERSAFPCTGCGRQLKVPAAAVAKQTVPPTPVPAPVPEAPAPEPEAAAPTPPRRRPDPEPETSVLPVVTPAPPPVVVTAPPSPGADGKPARDAIPPRGVRFLLWFVAIPLAFAVVLPLARALGVLSSNQIQDLALLEGVGRFWPIVRLLPFIAFAAALFVQGGTWGIAKLRERRWAEQAKTAGRPKSNGTRPRPPAKQPPPRRPQSTRTRA
jgi:hypothetical protein